MEITKWSRYANTDHSLCRKPRPGNSSLARANVTAHRRQEPMSREFTDWVDQPNHARPKSARQIGGLFTRRNDASKLDVDLWSNQEATNLFVTSQEKFLTSSKRHRHISLGYDLSRWWVVPLKRRIYGSPAGSPPPSR